MISRQHYRILTREEEIEAFRSGDRDALIQSIWPYVKRLALKYANADSMFFDELLSLAGLVLARALQTYDPDKSRWIAYAARFLKLQFYRLTKPMHTYSTDVAEFDRLLVGEHKEFDHVEHRDQVERAQRAMRLVCTEREIAVINAHCNSDTFAEIGAKLGITPTYAQTVEQRGLAKLRMYYQVTKPKT